MTRQPVPATLHPTLTRRADFSQRVLHERLRDVAGEQVAASADPVEVGGEL